MLNFTPDESFRKLVAAWKFLAAVPVGFTLLSWLLFSSAPLTGDDVRTIFKVLLALSVAIFGIQLFIRRGLRDQNLFARVMTPDGWGFSPEHIIKLNRASVEERGAWLILRVHRSMGIVIWLLAESIAFYGLILTVLSGEARYTYLFALLAFADLLYFYPRRSTYDGQVARWHSYLKDRS
jgi:hypothetical protein